MEFNIKGSGGELLQITVWGYAYPEADNDWDSNWLACQLKLWLRGFRAEFPFDLRIDDMTGFLRRLEQLQSSLTGDAVLENMDSVVMLSVRIDKTGKLKWEGRLVYPAGIGTVLEFEYESDQTFLPELIDEITCILERYPMRS